MRGAARRTERSSSRGSGGGPALALRARARRVRRSLVVFGVVRFVVFARPRARVLRRPRDARGDHDARSSASARGGPTTTAAARARWPTSSRGATSTSCRATPGDDPLRVTCPGRRDPRGFDVSSDGPDGEPRRARPCRMSEATTRGPSLVEGEADANVRHSMEAAGHAPRRSRGLTLVELVIVITIIGVLTAAISVGVLKAQKSANIGTAKTACSTSASATMQWKAVTPSEDCPTVEQLKTEKDLDTGFSLKDPWGDPFKVCLRPRTRSRARAPAPTAKRGPRTTSIVPQLDTGEKASDAPWCRPDRGRLGERARERRARRRGLTLIEIIVVIVDHRRRHGRGGRGLDAAPVGATERARRPDRERHQGRATRGRRRRRATCASSWTSSSRRSGSRRPTCRCSSQSKDKTGDRRRRSGHGGGEGGARRRASRSSRARQSEAALHPIEIYGFGDVGEGKAASRCSAASRSGRCRRPTTTRRAPRGAPTCISGRAGSPSGRRSSSASASPRTTRRP